MAISSHLRQLCSEGEYQLECFWAEKICRCETHEKGKHITSAVVAPIELNLEMTANETLLSFPYHSNYVDLVRMELNALASVSSCSSPRNFAILGSGPLALTSLCICNHLGQTNPGCISCLNIDRSVEAISSSSKMCQALGHTSDTMCFQCTNANSPDVDLSSFDVVYLAALVGDCGKDKHKIMADVVKRMKPGGMVVMRSAHSLRRLLYPVCSSTMLNGCLGFSLPFC